MSASRPLQADHHMRGTPKTAHWLSTVQTLWRVDQRGCKTRPGPLGLSPEPEAGEYLPIGGYPAYFSLPQLRRRDESTNSR